MKNPRLLTGDHQALVDDERAALTEVRDALQRLGASTTDLRTVDEAIRQLDELFLLVVVGEFNAGKSAVLNVLLGHPLLEEGVTPTTSRITMVRYGDEVGGPTVTESGLAEVTAPVVLLRDLHVVDTPGTNAVLREHEQLTREFVPRADLVLFITSADRPFTESERAFLELIRDWGKKIVLVVNKADILESPEHLATVIQFVRSNARTLLGLDPVVFPVSAKLARGGRADAAQWERSGFGAFEAHLEATLDERERLRLKLLNPLGVGERLASGLTADVNSRLELLREDVVVLGQVDRQLATYAEDMRRDFEFRMADIDKELVEMERRGHDHFDETIRLMNMRALLNRSRMQQLFEEKVVADTPARIERKVSELIDWLVDADFRQWQAVNDHLAERRAAHRDRLPGAGQSGRFHQDRGRLIDSVGRDAERIVETYNRQRESAEIAEKARGAVAASAALEVGALGLGAVVAAIASTAAADMTGIAMAGVVATIGLLVIPNRRKHAKQELREKVTALRERLSTSLRTAFEAELQRSLERVQHHIEPYSRFVRSEQQHLAGGQDTLQKLAGRFASLKDRIQRI